MFPFLQPSYSHIQGRFLDVGHHNFQTGLGEPGGHAESNSAGGSRDYGNLAIQIIHGVFPP